MYVSLCSNTAGRAQAGSSVGAVSVAQSNGRQSRGKYSSFFFGSNESAELKKLGSEGATGRERKGGEVGRGEVDIS